MEDNVLMKEMELMMRDVLLDLLINKEGLAECHWVHGGIQFHTFASYTFPCQMPFCQTSPLLQPVTQQKKCSRILVGKFNLYCHTQNYTESH